MKAPSISYKLNPSVVFQDREEDETVLLLLRKHVFTNLGWLTVSILAFLIPIFFLLTPYTKIFTFLGLVPQRYLLFLIIAWYQFLLSFLLVSFAAWFFNIDLVTDRRILDVDYWGFLYFNVAETTIDNIQDVTYNVSGLAQTVLNYGNVYIQTAAKEANFEFTEVPNPAAVHDLITDLMEKEHGRPH